MTVEEAVYECELPQGAVVGDTEPPESENEPEVGQLLLQVMSREKETEELPVIVTRTILLLLVPVRFIVRMFEVIDQFPEEITAIVPLWLS